MFSIKEAIRYGWQKLKGNLEISVLTTLLVFFFSMLTRAIGKDSGGFLLSLTLAISLIILKIGYTKMFLKIHDGEKPKFVEIFEEYRTFWRYLGTSVLFFLTFLGGLILLIIPGIFWAVRFSLSLIIVIDTKTGPIAAMKESYAITKGSFWKLLGFGIVMGLFNLLGLICLGVGLLITVPITTLTMIYVYRKLSEAKASLIQTPPSTPSPQAA